MAWRYLAVSAVNVVNHQAVLFVANGVWGWSGGRANVFAAIVAAVPAYLMSRYWVWEVRGSHSLRAEIVPFWGLALLGLVVSSALAEGADRAFGASLWVMVGSLTGYLVVWVLKFLILNRIFEHAIKRLEEVEVV